MVYHHVAVAGADGDRASLRHIERNSLVFVNQLNRRQQEGMTNAEFIEGVRVLRRKISNTNPRIHQMLEDLL
jgi:hypothetical protein